MVSQMTAQTSRVRPARRRSQPAPRTKRDVVTEFRTAEILRAAGRVFAERGFDQATIADIARMAGVAKGTVYLYYPSKQQVYAAVLRCGAADLAACTRAAMARATEIGGQVRGFIEAALRYFEQHPDFVRIYGSESGRPSGRHDPFARHLDERCGEPAKALDQVLQLAVRHRTIRRVRAEAAAVAILDVVRGIASRRLRPGGGTTLDEDIAFAFDLTWKGLGPR